ncbi:MAG: Stk1 family PASTA domain-containing Ser/Thr kinase [Propionibacteriaceae bacterium]|jgi:serine/threonine-protein kinase|nr:Stk1 family PASTA domain-containing Ser/Thr kinase [Propionibacteriaceae bacterium]
MASELSDDPMVGRVLDGRYEIIRKVAKGGMATVYQARDQRLGRIVAVKLMHDGLTSDPGYVARFNREARSAAGLTHPGIVSVFDQGIDQGRPFIVMEYVPGGTLRHLITNTAPIGPKRVVELMLPVVDAVAPAHEAGILHRDLKPENVLISDRNQIKVADFGLAKPVASQTNSNPGTLMGTVSYVSPEVVTNRPYDTRSDVYALGVILYEMLTGAKPHTGETPVAVAYSHVNKDVPAPSTALPASDTAIPDYLDALVLAATARDPNLRLRDAGVLAHHLRLVRDALARGIRSDPQLAAQMRVTSLDPGSQATETIPDIQVPPTVPVPVHDTPVMAPSAQTGSRPAPPQTPAPAPTARARPAKRKRRRGVGVIVVLLVLLLIAGLGGYGAWYFLKGRFTEVPAFVGMTEADARKLATKEKLTITFTPEYSEEVPSGEIISTNPTEGTQILINGEVAAVVSKGKERYAVPKVTGKSEDDARQAIMKANLVVGEVVPVYDDKVKDGLVVKQSVASGKKVKPGTAIDLEISQGPAPVDITSYEGQPYTDAKAHFKKLGLKVSKADSVYNNEIPKGAVVSQDPVSGQLLRGQTIKFIVSLGPELHEVPNVFKLSVDDATKKMEDAGFKVKVTYEAKLLNIVAKTSPKAGEMLAIGSTVELFVV